MGRTVEKFRRGVGPKQEEFNLRLDFDNGWTVSIIRKNLSYGLEMATIFEGTFKQFPGISQEDGIAPWLNQEDIPDLLLTIKNA